MALLGQIHIFLNVPNLYWTSHWMKLCCATLGISKRTEYVFRMDSDRFVCTWILFRLFLSFLDTEKARYWVKRHKHYCSPKENWWEHSPILKYTVLYYTTVHIIMCRLNMLCCIFFKIALKGFWCQASTRIKSLAFRQVENSWMDALSLTIVHTYTFMFVSKSVIFFSFFFFDQSSLFSAYDFKGLNKADTNKQTKTHCKCMILSDLMYWSTSEQFGEGRMTPPRLDVCKYPFYLCCKCLFYAIFVFS